MYIFLSLITFGIYALVSYVVYTIASKCDGRKTMHFCLMAFIVCPITCEIGVIVWYNNISGRTGNESAGAE